MTGEIALQISFLSPLIFKKVYLLDDQNLIYTFPARYEVLNLKNIALLMCKILMVPNFKTSLRCAERNNFEHVFLVLFILVWGSITNQDVYYEFRV